MVTRSHAFVPDEWYHCYTRGVEKKTVFRNVTDYERFLGLLYLSNAGNRIHRSDLKNKKLSKIFTIPRRETRTAIGAFCLMPNHIHLLLKEKNQGGISSFMLKLMTAYSMYFNIRYKHEGNVFTRPFRSRHVIDDRYFQRVVDYIHMNPAEMFEPKWKEGVVLDINALQSKLIAYPYSSFGLFYDSTRQEHAILDRDIFNIYKIKKPEKTLKNALGVYPLVRY